MNPRTLALATVIAVFAVLTTKALLDVGFWGILAPNFQSKGAAQVFTDLVIACLLACLWMVNDAKKQNLSPWPFVALTLAAGSFGPLFYLLIREPRAGSRRVTSWCRDDIVVPTMLQLQPLDAGVPIFRQLHTDQSPVILVNIFQVAEADIAALLAAWAHDANWMKQQPGYISTQLHQGIAGSTVFMNYAIWESVAHFRDAFNHPDFKQALAQYPSSVVASPHLFTRLTVPNLCVGP